MFLADVNSMLEQLALQVIEEEIPEYESRDPLRFDFRAQEMMIGPNSKDEKGL